MTGPNALAVALHDVWRWPDLREELAETARAAQPMALRDQADATCREVAEAAEGTAAILLTDAPEWLALTVTRELVAWVTAGAETCEHWPDVARPAPAFAASWRPEHVVCSACTDELVTAAPPRCALCGAGDAARCDVVLAGPLVYAVASCARCHPAAETTP